ncbi:MAG TPA: UDP-N-acetylmuramoyl-tripeptide--D-alanyl-D-alanine ligase [Candidatus Marinimicrobia bacterium]|nr:UDP-N-acetylmuramoyl-tripeptide--D-alanyl-D-alanine ligase [Candidatus Neomarinimicrobiota bacterium]
MKINTISQSPYFTLHNVKADSFDRVSIDTRKTRHGDMFCALKGERTDGHEFVPEAISKGAVAALVSEDKLRANPGLRKYPLIICPDTLKGLQSLAKLQVSHLKTKIIAITGSAGKTSTRQTIAHVLSGTFHVSQTRKNFNNEIGLPISILDIRQDSEYAVIEMGASKQGDIASLCEIVQPDYALITSISEAHIEGFGSLQNVQKGKFELFNHTKQEGTLFINQDDPLVAEYPERKFQRITYSLKQAAVVTMTIFDIDSLGRYILDYKGNHIYLRSLGFGAAQNALAACAVAVTLNIPANQIKRRLEEFEPPAGRGNIINQDGVTIVNDTYNANPLSVSMAIRTLNEMRPGGRRILILGDMLEMGELSRFSHENIGVQIASSRIDYLFCYGPETQNTVRMARTLDMTNAIHFDSIQAMNNTLKSLQKEGDIIYVKGSRGMAMERVVNDLTKGAKA